MDPRKGAGLNPMHLQRRKYSAGTGKGDAQCKCSAVAFTAFPYAIGLIGIIFSGLQVTVEAQPTMGQLLEDPKNKSFSKCTFLCHLDIAKETELGSHH